MDLCCLQDSRQGTVLVGIVSRGVHPSKHLCGDGGIYVRTDAIADWVETAAGVELDWDGYREPGSAQWSGPVRASRQLRGGCSVGAGSPAGLLGSVLLGLMLWGVSARPGRKGVGPVK